MIDVSAKRGDVVVVDFPRSVSPARKVRPAVVVSNDAANQFWSALTVVPITEWSEKKARLPVCVDLPKCVAGATKRSVVDCGVIQTIEKTETHPTGAAVLPQIQGRIDAALLIHLA